MGLTIGSLQEYLINLVESLLLGLLLLLLMRSDEGRRIDCRIEARD